MVKIVCGGRLAQWLAPAVWHALSKIPSSPCSLLVCLSIDVVVANGVAKLDHFDDDRSGFEPNQQIVWIKKISRRSSAYF
jgi:hypothetical protein